MLFNFRALFLPLLNFAYLGELNKVHYYLSKFHPNNHTEQVYNLIKYIASTLRTQNFTFAIDPDSKMIGYLRCRKSQNAIEFVCAVNKGDRKYDKDIKETFYFNGVKITLSKHSEDRECTGFCKLYNMIKFSLAIINEKYCVRGDSTVTPVKEFPGLYIVFHKGKYFVCNSLHLNENNVLLLPYVIMPK